MSDFDYKIFLTDNECESLATQMLAKQTAISTKKHELDIASDAYIKNNCGGLSTFLLGSDECNSLKKTMDEATESLDALLIENRNLQKEWITGGCEPSGVGGCKMEQLNFRSCIADISTLVNCSEASEKIMNKCCQLDHQITFYTNLFNAVLAKMTAKKGCLAAAWDMKKQVDAAEAFWTNQSNIAQSQAIYDEFQKILIAEAKKKNFTIVSSGNIRTKINTTNNGVKELTGSDVQTAQEFLNRVGDMFCNSSVVANILQFTLPTEEDNIGKDTVLPFGRTIECSGDTTMPSPVNYYCYTPIEGVAIEEGQTTLDNFCKTRLRERYGSQGATNHLYKQNTVGKGGVTLERSLVHTHAQQDFLNNIATACFKNARELYDKLHKRIYESDHKDIRDRDEAGYQLMLANIAKSGLIGELDKSQHKTTLAVNDSLREIIKSNVVSNVIFTYKTCDGTLTKVEQDPPDGSFKNMNYLVAKNGIVEIDIAAVQRRYPSDLACCSATTPPKTDGDFSYPVTVAATVKVFIPEDSLEGIRSMQGFKDLSKSKQDALIEGLQNVNCGQVLNYCIGQSSH